MTSDLITNLELAQHLADDTRKAIKGLQINSEKPRPAKKLQKEVGSFSANNIYAALLKLSEPLAQSYAQIKVDLQDENRLSWAGTAHEIREVLRGILEILAPDSDVKAQSDWKLEKDAKGPTQRQKVSYILRQHRSGSREEEVVQQLNTVEERISNLVRSTYSRASHAAHGTMAKKEVARILNYFEAFAHDLLNLE